MQIPAPGNAGLKTPCVIVKKVRAKVPTILIN